jgi:hypothetical protein
MDIVKTQIKKKYDWSVDKLNNVAKDYLNFLTLRAVDNTIIPDSDVDIFWNQHILNTYDYYNFCMKRFNKIIHNNPDIRLPPIEYSPIATPRENVKNIPIKILYTFNTYENEIYIGKQTKKSSGYKYDKQIYMVKQSGTIGTLIEHLSKVMKHPKELIHVFDCNVDEIKRDTILPIQIPWIKKLSDYDQLTVVMEEQRASFY